VKPALLEIRNHLRLLWFMRVKQLALVVILSTAPLVSASSLWIPSYTVSKLEISFQEDCPNYQILDLG